MGVGSAGVMWVPPGHVLAPLELGPPWCWWLPAHPTTPLGHCLIQGQQEEMEPQTGIGPGGPGKGLGWGEQGGAGSSHRLVPPHRDPRDNPLPAPFLSLKPGWICIPGLPSLVNFYLYFVERKLWRARGRAGMLWATWICRSSPLSHHLAAVDTLGTVHELCAHHCTSPPSHHSTIPLSHHPTTLLPP